MRSGDIEKWARYQMMLFEQPESYRKKEMGRRWVYSTRCLPPERWH